MKEPLRMPWLLPAHVRISAHPDLIAILIEYQLFTYLAGERFQWQAITDRHIFFLLPTWGIEYTSEEILKLR